MNISTSKSIFNDNGDDKGKELLIKRKMRIGRHEW